MAIACPTYEGLLFTGRASVNLPSATDARLPKVSDRRAGHGREAIATIWERSVRVRQAELCEEVFRALCRLQARTGDLVDVTCRSLMEAAGWPIQGLTVRQADQKFGRQLRNALTYLEEWKLIENRHALYEPNGEGRCIVVTLPAGVAQSVRASRRSVAPARRRPSFPRELSAPLRGDIGGWGTSSCSESQRRERLPRAGARGGSVHATVSPSLSSVRAALAAAQLSAGLEGREPTGVALLEKVPVLADAPVSLLARAAWAQAGHRDLRLSVGQREQLELAVGQLERAGYGVLPAGRPAAAAALIDLAFGGWREFWNRNPKRSDGKPAVTPGALAICARRLAHLQLKAWRARRRRVSRRTSTEGSRG